MFKTLVVRGFFTVVVAGAGLVTLDHMADAACFIGWDVFNTECELADGERHAAFELCTSFYSQGKNQWTLFQAPELPSNNLSNESVTPGSQAIDDGGGTTAGEIESDCEADLDEQASSGTYTLSAWDGSGAAECSGSHNVTIKPSTSSCQP